ncbi:MAG TPA: radical SAM protein [Chitinophagales bacterium]|nr:radical SAM protein [Chitinophagales bacterium]
MIEPALLNDYNNSRIHPAGFNSSLKAYDKFCYAPFSSLYFAHEGRVLACCENRTHVLGTYPQNSICEIWNGAAAVELRQYISEFNLAHGCKGCDFDLKSRNFGGIKSRSFDVARLHQRDMRYPGMMEFELENTCNLECVMCNGIFSSSIRRNREQLPPIPSPYDDEFVRQLEEFIPHLALANFFGGEPFLVEIYLKIWEKMAKLNPGMNVWVTTNGTILNNRIVQLLNRIRFNLTISIDSIEKETYEKIRVNSNFERVMENFKRFLRYTKTINSDFTVNTCPMTVNWRGLPEIVKWGNSEGFVVNIIPVRHPEELSLGSLSYNELSRIIDFYTSAEITSSDIYSERNKKNFESYIRFVEQWRQHKKLLEQHSTEAEKHQPEEEIKRRFTTALNLSSLLTDEEKKTRIGLAMEKLLRMNEKFEHAHPYLKEIMWKRIFEKKPDDLLSTLLHADERIILAQEKIPVGEKIDCICNPDSLENLHLKKMKLYLEYCVIAGDSPQNCNDVYNKWKTFLQGIKSKNEVLYEALLSVVNKGRIALLAEMLLHKDEKTFLKNFSHETVKRFQERIISEAEIIAQARRDLSVEFLKNESTVNEFMEAARHHFAVHFQV